MSMLLADPSTAELRVQRVSDADALNRLKDDWNALAGEVPFRRWEWLEAWWRHYRQPGDEPFVLCLYDPSGRLVGLAPWYLRPATLSGNVIRFLGSGKVCSDYLTVLTAEGFEGSVARRLARWLLNESDRLWDAVELEGVEAVDAVIGRCVEELQRQGHSVYREPGLNCWRITLPTNWEAYVAQLSKSRRERVRQLIRRKFDTGAAVARMVQTGDELQRGFDVLVDLHQRRRASLGDDGCFSSKRFTKFLRDVAGRFLALGRLRLQWVELDGRPVAAEFDLAGGQTVYYYQSGIAPDCPRDRPGWLGTTAAVRAAIEQGFTRFDFLRGDETYKSHWRAEPVPTANIRIAARTTGSRLRHEMWLRQHTLKKWLKRKLDR